MDTVRYEDQAELTESVRRYLRQARAEGDLSFARQAHLLQIPRSTLEAFDKGRKGMTDGMRQGIRRTYPVLIPKLTELSLTWLRDEAALPNEIGPPAPRG